MTLGSIVTVTDLFCGAGGSSLGASQAGAEIRMALNHWELAIQTHNTNFPQTDHHCCDASQADPRYYPRTTVLIASPECTNHSLAKGKRRPHYQADIFGKSLVDPAEERSRATMWDVPRFAECHRYELVIVENVVDARSWVLWDSWLHAMHALGYEHRCVYLNSMIAWPTPQSRDRLYVVFWRRGNRAPDLDIRPPCHCPRCAATVAGVQTWKRPGRQWGRYGRNGQYTYRCPACQGEAEPYYYPALTAIDWSLPIGRIGDRKRPLGEKTLARIRLGLERFADQRLLVDLLYNHGHDKRARPVTDPAPTQTGQQALALVSPFLAALRTNSTPRGLHEPVQTIVTDNQHFLVQPGIVELRNHGSVRPADEPLATVAANGNHHGLLMPFLASYYSTPTMRPVTDPLGTLTSEEKHGLVMPEPFIVGQHSPKGDDGGVLRGVSGPLPTIPTVPGHALAVPFIASQYGGDSRHPVHHVGEPLPTVPGMAVHYLAEPGRAPAVEDCGFRMLEPHEIGAAMAFPTEYRVMGNKRERVKQFGNAVTPPVLRLLMERCLATLSGEGAA